jgi:transposase
MCCCPVFLLGRMLARIDAVSADIAALDTKVEAEMAPFAAAMDKLDEIPGINPGAAQVILAEIGTNMQRLPAAGHLVSRAEFGHESFAGSLLLRQVLQMLVQLAPTAAPGTSTFWYCGIR